MNLIFVTNANTGNIGFVATANYFQHTIYAWLPIGEFDEIYDLLRNEAPIQASYFAETDDPWNPTTNATSSQVRWVRIGTGSEPIGEGSGDDSGDMFAIVQALAPELVTERC